MIVFVMMFCSSYSGCMNYEFKDKVQCEHAVILMKEKVKAGTNYAFCLEVRK